MTPEEVETALSGAGMKPETPIGVSFYPLSGQWKLTGDASVNYMVVARRPGA